MTHFKNNAEDYKKYKAIEKRKNSESELNDLLATGVKPWDIVMLKGRTGRYRVYGWGKSDFIFACLDADVITTSGRDEVSKIIERSS
jgi:hypothetical protein